MDREQVVKLLRDIQNSPGFYNDIIKKKEHTINTLYASQNSINRGNNPILLIY